MRNALNFILSATDATISAGVIMANIIWNTIHVMCGIVGTNVHPVSAEPPTGP
jgi:hypothetical protein